MEITKNKLSGYVVGFIISIALTLLAYELVGQHLFDYATILGIIASLAVVQLFVQLVFFLHLGKESKPRWNFLMFGFAVLVVVIVVGGSLWIMNNLNYNMMHTNHSKEYMHDHEGF